MIWFLFTSCPAIQKVLHHTYLPGGLQKGSKTKHVVFFCPLLPYSYSVFIWELAVLQDFGLLWITFTLPDALTNGSELGSVWSLVAYSSKYYTLKVAPRQHLHFPRGRTERVLWGNSSIFAKPYYLWLLSKHHRITHDDSLVIILLWNRSCPDLCVQKRIASLDTSIFFRNKVSAK